MHDDLDGFPTDKYAVMTVNDIGAFLHARIDHMYSNHGHMLPLIKNMRAARHRYRRFDEKVDLHTIEDQWVPGTTGWPFPGHGSSGLGAIYVGLALGYEPIVLAGCPMDNTGHFFDPPLGHPMAKVRLTNFDPQEAMLSKTNKNEKIWRRANETIFEGRVKSLSGKTRDWLGAP